MLKLHRPHCSAAAVLAHGADEGDDGADAAIRNPQGGGFGRQESVRAGV
jgi:hypothetical protein